MLDRRDHLDRAEVLKELPPFCDSLFAVLHLGAVLRGWRLLFMVASRAWECRKGTLE